MSTLATAAASREPAAGHSPAARALTSAAISAARLGNRSPGRTASARLITAHSGRGRSSSGSGTACVPLVGAGAGVAPLTASSSATAKLYWSERASGGSPRACSGAT